MSLHLWMVGNKKTLDLAEKEGLERPFSVEETLETVFHLMMPRRWTQMDFWYISFRSDGTLSKVIFLYWSRKFMQMEECLLGLIQSHNANTRIKGARDVKYFQPVSLTTSLNKIIAKVLSNRLKEVLAQVRRSSVLLFVHGRRIHDDVQIAKNALKIIRPRRERASSWRLTFGQAYREVSTGAERFWH